jgi:hypothetical protein
MHDHSGNLHDHDQILRVQVTPLTQSCQVGRKILSAFALAAPVLFWL